jgi:ribonuclease D
VQRHTDWSSPHLTPEQVRYAISDVTLLIPLKEKLDEMLSRQGRRALAEECFRVIPVMARLDLLGFELLFEH